MIRRSVLSIIGEFRGTWRVAAAKAVRAEVIRLSPTMRDSPAHPSLRSLTQLAETDQCIPDALSGLVPELLITSTIILRRFAAGDTDAESCEYELKLVCALCKRVRTELAPRGQLSDTDTRVLRECVSALFALLPAPATPRYCICSGIATPLAVCYSADSALCATELAPLLQLASCSCRPLSGNLLLCRETCCRRPRCTCGWPFCVACCLHSRPRPSTRSTLQGT